MAGDLAKRPYYREENVSYGATLHPETRGDTTSTAQNVHLPLWWPVVLPIELGPLMLRFPTEPLPHEPTNEPTRKSDKSEHHDAHDIHVMRSSYVYLKGLQASYARVWAKTPTLEKRVPLGLISARLTLLNMVSGAIGQSPLKPAYLLSSISITYTKIIDYGRYIRQVAVYDSYAILRPKKIFQGSIWIPGS